MGARPRQEWSINCSTVHKGLEPSSWWMTLCSVCKRVVYVARSPSTILKEECGNASSADGPIRTRDSTCPVRGSARLPTDLRAVLPPLARRYKVPLEVIAEDAADRLSKAGGIGSWLK